MEILSTKKCLNCEGMVTIYKASCPSLQARQDVKRFCNPHCARKYGFNQKMADPDYKAAFVSKIKETLAKPEHRKRFKSQNLGSTAPWWKDNNATYNSKHRWVQKHFKRSGKCEHCGITPPPTKNGRSGTEWSNISGMYDRNNRKDWQELCSKCHKFFDKAQRIARGGKVIDTTK